MEKEIILKNIVKGHALSNDEAMALAIQVGSLGASFVSPNPLVGCVILDAHNRFLASGYHEKYGEAHAEINALKYLAPDELIQATVFVTLEPCAHIGKTGSCAKKLSEYKIKKVIYGLEDPNPVVSGQGAQILKSAGIEAELYQGKLVPELECLAEIFLKNFRFQKPFVSLKVATSLDGQMALSTGESQWITTPQSREYVHELRSYYDAILVGRKTIEMDNPSLNIRHPQIIKKNKIIILDPQGTLLKKIESGQDYKFLEVHEQKNIFFAVNENFESTYSLVQFKTLDQLLNQLFEIGIKSLFIEGGSITYSSFLQNQLVDRLHLFMNASIIGHKNGLSWTKDFGLNSLDQKNELQNLKTKIFGQDIYLTGRF